MNNRLMLNELHKEILEKLTKKEFLKQINMSEEKIQSFIINRKFVNNLLVLLSKKKIMCNDVLDLAIDILNSVSTEKPKDWLYYIFQYTLGKSFIGAVKIKLNSKYESASLIYLEILRTILKYEEKNKGFDNFSNFNFLLQEELEASPNKEEYVKFIDAYNKNYVYELMRLDKEINGYNTLEHVAGVHYVAMHIARQLHKFGMTVDLGLVSGAAAGHDIGKYGCKEEEKSRVAYLHYYYTEQWFIKNKMTNIAHIAVNHSTWDLELETLSLESLILIYADFRVKNKESENSQSEIKKQMHIYSLADSFQVILNKLDNVDEKKEKRYIRVYEKLKDFENYLLYRGINVDLTRTEPIKKKEIDFAMLDIDEAIENFKYMAITHNTSLMSKLNNEAMFTSMIEAARSEKNWKNIRDYLNILEEYSQHLTQKQKIYTLSFLYELLINRESDIRRQSAKLMGGIIISFDVEYKKELPADARVAISDDFTSLKLWEKYLNLIIRPDHKFTEQHKEWIGYTLRIFVDAVITNCCSKDKDKFIDVFINYFNEDQSDYVATLNLLNSLLSVPFKILENYQSEVLLNYALKALDKTEIEIKLMSVQYMDRLVKQNTDNTISMDKIVDYIQNFNKEEGICINFLKYKMAINLKMSSDVINKYEIYVNSQRNITSDLFLNNLKAATPWNVKTISIDFIMDDIQNYNEVTLFQTATHLCNLVKVTAKESSRNKAGNSLLELAHLLSIDQRNELAFELFKGLEIDELQYAKYIPEYLGRFVMHLHPKELDEFIKDLNNVFKAANGRTSSLVINTFGVMVQYYSEYKNRFFEPDDVYERRLVKMLGIVLSGLANYNVQVKQESFLVIGQNIFGSKKMDLNEKHKIFSFINKKLLTLINEKEVGDLFFFNNSSSFNHIYRFISDYIFNNGDFNIKENKKIAFFPGTFDPFSLSHKGIVSEIRNMGFEVYLAVDEFSWSKRVQPRLIRRQIINMSIADELHVYLFPDDVPVNLTNNDDLANLRNMFKNKDVYIVVGSDVIVNASAYKQRPTKTSIHSFNHVVFKRAVQEMSTSSNKKYEDSKNRIKGEVVELSLPVYLEDISSTQIRDNIDNNRDISYLIDPMAQSFIYDKNLYLREPQYKSVLKTKHFRVEIVEDISKNIVDEIGHYIFMHTNLYENIGEKLISKKISLVVLRDGKNSNKLLGFVAFHHISSSEIYTEFKSEYIANYLREHTAGRIVIIDGIYISPGTAYDNLEQVILTETLAHCLKNDFTYALFYNTMLNTVSDQVYETLELQGFDKITDQKINLSVYHVDMKFPICLTLNLESFIKEPLNHSKRVHQAIATSRKALQKAMTNLYKGNLVLSFDNDMINQTLIRKVCELNKVPDEEQVPRALGESMCVPFGNILKGMVVPNTVTKSLHTEKVFESDARHFKITEYPFYSPLNNQMKIIKSFDRPVILVDDLMHKGYRIRIVDPLVKAEDIKVQKIIVGIMSGRGRDLMAMQGRDLDCAYFIPNLRIWFNENLMYPFLGGDGISSGEETQTNLIPSINLILPYVAPMYISGASNEDIYNLSMVCLQNTKRVLTALETEYQEQFEKNLTVKRLGEVLITPRFPYLGKNISYDLNIEASSYLDVSIENLSKLERIIK